MTCRLPSRFFDCTTPKPRRVDMTYCYFWQHCAIQTVN